MARRTMNRRTAPGTRAADRACRAVGARKARDSESAPGRRILAARSRGGGRWIGRGRCRGMGARALDSADGTPAAATAPGSEDLPVLRRAPGRHRHTRAGPAALRRIRRDARRLDDGARPAAQDWTDAAARHDPGPRRRCARPDVGSVRRAAGRHWRGARAPASRADDHVRFRAVAVHRTPTAATGSASRSAARGASQRCRTSSATTSTPDAAAAICASRPAPTTRRSRCTRSATSAASPSGAAASAGRSSASAARRRPRPRSHATQPVRVQGRHRATSTPRTPRHSTSTSGSAAADATRWLAGGSYLVARRIAMTHRDLGPRAPSRAGAAHRPDEGRGRAAVRRRRVHRAGLRRTDASRRRAADRRPTRTCGSRTPPPTAARGCCAAATTSSTATTTLGRLDAGLFFLAFQRIPARISSRCKRRSRGRRVSEYLKHVGSAMFAIPPGVAQGEFVGQALFA